MRFIGRTPDALGGTLRGTRTPETNLPGTSRTRLPGTNLSPGDSSRKILTPRIPGTSRGTSRGTPKRVSRTSLPGTYCSSWDCSRKICERRRRPCRRSGFHSKTIKLPVLAKTCQFNFIPGTQIIICETKQGRNINLCVIKSLLFLLVLSLP